MPPNHVRMGSERRLAGWPWFGSFAASATRLTDSSQSYLSANTRRFLTERGLERRGLERRGLERRGLERRGLERRGLERRGLERRGLESAGLDCGHQPSAFSQ